jgi:hypothetical protein
MKRPRNIIPVSDWKNLNNAYEQSGQTQQDFCRAHNLAPSIFQKWRRHFKSCESNEMGFSRSAPGFKPIVMAQPSREPLSAFSKPSCWDIELELPDGMFLRIRKGAA